MVQDLAPTSLEIERQLVRMLSSVSFKKAPKQATLLEYIVKSFLKGIDVSEDVIGYDLYAHYVPDVSTDVRVGARNLRLRLTEYYAGEGKDDPILIELPADQDGYRPRCILNPRSPASTAYRRGLYHLSRLSSHPHVQPASSAFEHAIKLHPNHAAAHVGLAEASLLSCLFTDDERPNDLLEAAEASVQEALSHDDQYWRGHLILGVLRACRWDWDGAENAFDQSLKLAPSETRSSLWYAAFLMATSKEDTGEDRVVWEEFRRHKVLFEMRQRGISKLSIAEIFKPLAEDALKITSTHANNAPGDAFAHFLHCIFRYAARELRIEWTKNLADDLFAGDWHRSIMIGCMRFATDIPHLHEATLDYKSPYRINRYLEFAAPGLAILFAADAGDHTWAREAFARLKSRSQKRYVRPLQLALAYLAFGDCRKALIKLSAACAEHDPFVVWLHLWPFFDRLKDRKSFNALLSKIGLAQK